MRLRCWKCDVLDYFKYGQAEIRTYDAEKPWITKVVLADSDLGEHKGKFVFRGSDVWYIPKEN